MRSDCGKVPFPNRIRFAFALLYEWSYGEGRAKVGRCLVDRGLRFLFFVFFEMEENTEGCEGYHLHISELARVQ